MPSTTITIKSGNGSHPLTFENHFNGGWFKKRVSELTGVTLEKLKIYAKGELFKDEDLMEKLGLLDGQTLVIRNPDSPAKGPTPTPSSSRLVCTFPGCSKSYARQAHFNRHVACHSGEAKDTQVDEEPEVENEDIATKKPSKKVSKYVCEVCRKSFTSISTRESHYKTHLLPTDFAWGDFDPDKTVEKYVNGLDDEDVQGEPLVSDKPKKSKSNKAEHVCLQCNRTFKRAEHLRRHTLIHTGAKEYVCQACGKGFSRGDNCMAHYQTHFKPGRNLLNTLKSGFDHDEAVEA